MFIYKVGNIQSMKYINLTFEDLEYKKIKDLKENLNISWHDFIIKLVEMYKDE